MKKNIASGLFVLLFIFVIYLSVYFSNKTEYWAAITALASILLFIVTFKYTNYTREILDKSNKNSEYLVLKDINQKFNEERFVHVYNLAINSKIDIVANSGEENLKLGRLTYSSIKTILIDPIEEIAISIELGLLSYSTIDKFHGYTILKLGSLEIIRNCIDEYSRNNSNSVYHGFMNLYNEIINKFLPDNEKFKYKLPFETYKL